MQANTPSGLPAKTTAVTDQTNLSNLAGALDSTPLANNDEQAVARAYYNRRRQKLLLKYATLSIIVLTFGAGGILALRSSSAQSGRQDQTFPIVQIPLSSLDPASKDNSADLKLNVNGRLQVRDSLTLQPASTPLKPQVGQLYLDKQTKRLTYYNGEQFISLGGSGTVNNIAGDTNITNVTNITNNSQAGSPLAVPPSILLQSTAPSIQQAGGFSVSGSGVVGTLKTASIDSSGATLYVNPVGAIQQQAIAPGTPASIGLTSGSISAPGPGWANNVSATKVTMGEVGGTATSISTYFISGLSSDHVQVAIYDDDGNTPSRPGNLLATSTIGNLVPDGLTTIAVPTVTLAANTSYWLAVNTDSATAGRTYNGGSKSSCFAFAVFGSMHDPYGGCFFDNGTYSISLNYLVGAGVSGTASPAMVVLGPTGQATFRNTADSNTAFQVQNASGTSTVLNVDTQNGRVGIGKITPGYKLDIAGGDINLSNGRSIRFGGSQALSMNGTGDTTSLTNFTSGGKVSVQADNFVVQDANATRSMLNIDTVAGSVLLSSAGSGDVSIATAASNSATGNISITTGASSSTASGNITIDSGSGIIDGTVVETKTFEGGTENMLAWFGDTVAQSAVQAHGGANSLAVTLNSPFWGVISNPNFPIAAVTPGHQYQFSFWVRAGSVPRTIATQIIWYGAAASPTNLQTVTDSATGWTEVTGLGQAPAGATGAYYQISSSNGGGVGEVHYFDDMVITDLSSASAFSSIEVGKTNAKVITIGNLNQIGATTINGGSGINLNSGAGSLTANGGVVSITGNAASRISTTAGALTLTSAGAATWGVGVAANGPGDSLTLQAGSASASSGGNGGNLILRGGTKDGLGVEGGIIVTSTNDSPLAFQVQNSAGSGFLTADSVNKAVRVIGTSSAFASLTLTDAHFKSTQTTAPTIGAPINCGASSTANVTAGSTDAAGSFDITTGTGGTSSSCDTVISFNQPYGAAPKSVIVVGKANAASAARLIYVSASTANTFTVSFGQSAGGANTTAYSFSYWVVE